MLNSRFPLATYFIHSINRVRDPYCLIQSIPPHFYTDLIMYWSIANRSFLLFFRSDHATPKSRLIYHNKVIAQLYAKVFWFFFFPLASLPPFSFHFRVTPAAASYACEETGPNKRGRALGLKRGGTRQGAGNAWLPSILHGKLRKRRAYTVQTRKLELRPNFTLKTLKRSNIKCFLRCKSPHARYTA